VFFKYIFDIITFGICFCVFIQINKQLKINEESLVVYSEYNFFLLKNKFFILIDFDAYNRSLLDVVKLNRELLMNTYFNQISVSLSF
jgi:hypothetical protein